MLEEIIQGKKKEILCRIREKEEESFRGTIHIKILFKEVPWIQKEDNCVQSSDLEERLEFFISAVQQNINTSQKHNFKIF